MYKFTNANNFLLYIVFCWQNLLVGLEFKHQIKTKILRIWYIKTAVYLTDYLIVIDSH